MQDLASLIERTARTWHGVVPVAKADDYFGYFNKIALPDYQGTPGNKGVTFLRRVEGDTAHFLLITLWESLDSIKQFAGHDVETARYYPEDTDFLLEFEPNAFHYQVLNQP
jgi:heme-degrading monooxygenase HmoA